MAGNYLQTRVLTHKQKVLSLFKRACRNAESFHMERSEVRFAMVMLRHRFEQHRHELDLRVAAQLLIDGEKELDKNMHHQPKRFLSSPGGVAYNRYLIYPDWLTPNRICKPIVDYWHPLEKAQYPEYFARREQRKKEYIERWEKEYGKPTESH